MRERRVRSERSRGRVSLDLRAAEGIMQMVLGIKCTDGSARRGQAEREKKKGKYRAEKRAVDVN